MHQIAARLRRANNRPDMGVPGPTSIRPAEGAQEWTRAAEFALQSALGRWWIIRSNRGIWREVDPVNR